MLLLGYDIGSSAVKASLADASTAQTVASASSPEGELDILSPRMGWAEQHPETWWEHLRLATGLLLDKAQVEVESIEAIGISYQMHGLVLVDKQHKVLRPSIIWCDGRAVEIGTTAFEELGEEFCLHHLLNSPGNFTASKLKWVREHEPEIFAKIHKAMLPGDYIAMKLSGEITTTPSGLSEGTLWDHQNNSLSQKLLDYFEIPDRMIPPVRPNFGNHGKMSASAAEELGLKKGIRLTYRAGDQPNNALALSVMEPGEVASTAGTSGVVYGVTDQPVYDNQSRVNTFLHVNHSEEKQRYGVLLCVNGTGIQYRWLRKQMLQERFDYQEMNKMAGEVEPGAGGLTVIPFGNGPERILKNQNAGARFVGIDFNRHHTPHLIRAAKEGIACAMNYGLEIMRQMDMEIDLLRAGSSNMFQSRIFTEALCNISGLPIELYDTDGAKGAAIGAGIGAEIYQNREDAFRGLEKVSELQAETELQEKYRSVYKSWRSRLDEIQFNR